MRRILITLATLFIITGVFGQKNNYDFYIGSVSFSLKNHAYMKAKEDIDIALTFEEAKTDAKAWYYAGNTYLHIYRLVHYMDFITEGMNKATVVSKMGREPNRTKRDKSVDGGELWYYYYDNIEGIKNLQFILSFENDILKKIDEPEGSDYKNLAVKPLELAYKYYQKALEINPQIGNPFIAPINAVEGMNFVAGQFYNEGVIAYNVKDYPKAAAAFAMTSFITGEYTPSIDTISTENAAMAYKFADNPEKSIEFYSKLIEIGFKKAHVFYNLGEMAKQSGDTAKAFEYIKEGRSLFPEDFDLLISETNLYLNTGQMDAATNNLMKAKEKDPKNANLHYVIGTQYFDRLKELDFTADSVIYNKTFKLAQEYLTQATVLDSNYFEALYNLGALYVNEGVRVFEIADKLDIMKEIKQYNALKLIYESHWTKAMYIMEHAARVNPKDLDTLQTLRQLYARNDKLDKIKGIDEKIKELTGGE